MFNVQDPGVDSFRIGTNAVAFATARRRSRDDYRRAVHRSEGSMNRGREPLRTNCTGPVRLWRFIPTTRPCVVRATAWKQPGAAMRVALRKQTASGNLAGGTPNSDQYPKQVNHPTHAQAALDTARLPGDNNFRDIRMWHDVAMAQLPRSKEVHRDPFRCPTGAITQKAGSLGGLLGICELIFDSALAPVLPARANVRGVRAAASRRFENRGQRYRSEPTLVVSTT